MYSRCTLVHTQTCLSFRVLLDNRPDDENTPLVKVCMCVGEGGGALKTWKTPNLNMYLLSFFRISGVKFALKLHRWQAYGRLNFITHK